MSDTYPGQLPGRGAGPLHPAQFAGVNSQPSSEAPAEHDWRDILPADQRDAASLDRSSDDPVPQRMGPTDHFNPQQFSSVRTSDDVPQ